jgi:SPX domain protein involved in polyphosphate accumulation
VFQTQPREDPDRRIGQMLRFPQRYEYKYVVDPHRAAELRAVVSQFVPPDPFAALCPGFAYPICSLYLDTEDMRLYRQSLTGEKTRFKLRLRTYSDDPDSVVLLEIKRRLDRIVQKRRVALKRRHIELFAERGTNGWTQGIPEPVLRELEIFADHTRLASARPLLKVRYMREAYESPVEPLRITFDTEIAHAVSFDWNLLHADGRWQPTPLPRSNVLLPGPHREDRAEFAVFEIKFTDVYPSWVQDLVRRFELEPRSVPKYALSLDELFRISTDRVVREAGFRLPRRG